MPALQVREFPDELYERLKVCAAAAHRSVAQQTVVAVERMLDGCDGCNGAAAKRPAHMAAGFDSRAERLMRAAKRRAILERARARRAAFPDGIPHPADLLHEARAARDGDFDGLMGGKWPVEAAGVDMR